MGPTNQALLELFRADTALRNAQTDLDQATRGVRIQKKRAELAEQALVHTSNSLKHAKAQQMELDSDLKQRDEHIEHLRLQQQEAQNQRQYQAFLIDINSQKVDRGKVEEQAVAKLTLIEQLTAQQVLQTEQAKDERHKAQELESAIGEKAAELEARIADLQPKRDAAADKVPAKAVSAFNRLADNYEGEAMAPLGHIEGREERYYCTACNMELVVDVYNRLRTRDDVVICPGCGRLLYIPEDLTPEMAIKTKKTAKRATRAKSPKTAKKTAAASTKKDKKGVPANIKRVLTTAAAESLRLAKLEETAPIECEVKIAGIEDAVGPFRVKDRDSFARLVAGKMQGANIETAYEIIDLASPGDVDDLAPPVVEADDAAVDEGLVQQRAKERTTVPPDDA